MENLIFVGVIGFCLGYLASFYLMLFMDVKRMQKKLHDLHVEPHHASLHAYRTKQSPNKAFIERYGDRRKPDQSWGEQVSQAYGVGSKRPVLVRKIKA